MLTDRLVAVGILISVWLVTGLPPLLFPGHVQRLIAWMDKFTVLKIPMLSRWIISPRYRIFIRLVGAFWTAALAYGCFNILFGPVPPP